jgi:hypothetical protein
MTRNRDEFEERNAERAFAELRDGIKAPSPDELRGLARAASSAPRTPIVRERTSLRVRLRWPLAAAATLLVGSALGFGAGSFTRGGLIPAGDFAAFVSAGRAVAAPAAVSTRSCAPAGPFFNVQIIGNKEASFWAQPHLHPELFAGIPPKKSLVAIWTFGTQAGREPALYAWAADGRTRFSMRCRARTARAPSRGDLRPVLRVEDGWAFGGRFECDHRGRFVIQTERLGRRTRLAVWIERTGELIAMAEVGPREAWARVAERCAKRTG